MAKHLIIRLSAMGDVALSVPVLQAAAREYPSEQWLVLTRKPFHPFFKGLENVMCIEPDLYGKHKGLMGLYRLVRDIRSAHDIRSVLDLHNVLRSIVIRTIFKLSGTSVSIIDKGRKEKKQLVSQKKRELKPLPHTTERYAEVFAKAGFPLKTLANFEPLATHFPFTARMHEMLGEKKGTWIGIAPFAKHKQKKYPLEKMREVLEQLAQLNPTIFLFGGGEEERKAGETLRKGLPFVRSIIGELNMQEELALMSLVDSMLTMDSGNMHLASLMGTPVFSIWGGTHPFAGFAPFGQPIDSPLLIQTEMLLECRPCSVFGNKLCTRGDWACLHAIEPKTVSERIKHKMIGQ